MKTLYASAAMFALLMLTSCGGSKPAPKKSDAPSESKTASEKSAEPAKTAEKSAEPAKTEATEKTAEPAKTESAKTEPAKVEAPKPAPAAADDKPVWGKATDAEGDPIGGKTIGYYVNDLAEKDKEKLLTAIEYCRMSGNKASRGIPMLEKLSKNADKEIADAAAEALKEVKR